MRPVIDQGKKEDDCYEFYPQLTLQGVCIPSFDIGKKHFGVFIEQVSVTGEQRCVYAGVWKLGEKITLATQQRLISLLERLTPFFLCSKVALIEQQRALNYGAVRLQQICLTWLELRHPTVFAINVQSDLKYRKMDGPLGDQKHKRKTWAVEKCIDLFKAKGDPVLSLIRSLDFIRLQRKEAELKADDVCDAALQLLGWLTTLKEKEREKYLR